MATKTPNKNQRRTQAGIRIVIMAAILICVNILASYFHNGLDLTQEKRFTLSPATKKLLHNMTEVAVIDVYLKGKFPADLQRLQESVREELTAFKDVAGNKIIFRFIDPLEGKTDKEQKQIAHDLDNKGMRLMELRDANEEGYSLKKFLPYAFIHYNGKEQSVDLLENPPGKSSAERTNYAEAALEYKFANAINQLNKPAKTKVAYIVGNGEALGIKTNYMLGTLPYFYDVDTVDLSHTLSISRAYDIAMIIQPTTPFTGPDKLKIDQFVMRGGRVLWNVSPLKASLDSLFHSPQFIAMEYGLNLDDILFKYGVRVNNDLIEDMQNIPLPRTTNDGRPELFPWAFFPKLNPTADNPIVRNMDFVMSGFTSSIDTLLTTGIKKTILLQSSKYSRTATAPVRVSLSMMNYPLKNEMFNKPYKPVAVLLEGKFQSVYKKLLAPEYLRLLDSLGQPFKPSCDVPNKMIVTSAGEIFSNGYTAKDGPLPIGYYQYTGEYFANYSFLLNCLEYLSDSSGVLEARSKQVKLRLLDTGRAKDEKATWQVVNVGIPIAAVLVFASCYYFFRKRRYEVKKDTPKTLSKNA